MNNNLTVQIKQIITHTVGVDIVPNPLPDDYPLVGNLLDSLAITNLIVALEEHFGFVFDDDDLSAEAFEGSSDCFQRKFSDTVTNFSIGMHGYAAFFTSVKAFVAS